MKVVLGVGVVVAAVWVIRQIGFIRMETPLSEQKQASPIFAPQAPRYRRTQSTKVRSFREWRDRYDHERRRA